MALSKSLAAVDLRQPQRPLQTWEHFKVHSAAMRCLSEDTSLTLDYPAHHSLFITHCSRRTQLPPVTLHSPSPLFQSTLNCGFSGSFPSFFCDLYVISFFFSSLLILLSVLAVVRVQWAAGGTRLLRVRPAVGQDEAGAAENGGEAPQRADVEVRASATSLKKKKSHVPMLCEGWVRYSRKWLKSLEKKWKLENGIIIVISIL